MCKPLAFSFQIKKVFDFAKSRFRAFRSKFSLLSLAGSGTFCLTGSGTFCLTGSETYEMCPYPARTDSIFTGSKYRSLRSGCKITGTLGQIRMCFLSISYFDGYFFIFFIQILNSPKFKKKFCFYRS